MSREKLFTRLLYEIDFFARLSVPTDNYKSSDIQNTNYLFNDFYYFFIVTAIAITVINIDRIMFQSF